MAIKVSGTIDTMLKAHLHVPSPSLSTSNFITVPMVIENLMDHVTFTCQNGFRTHSVYQCKFVGDGAGDGDSTCKRALNFDGDFDGHGCGDVTCKETFR